MAIVCVDAGTSVVKAVVFDDDGTEISVARRVTSVERPRPGFSEQDMTAVAHAVFSVIAECAAGADVDVVAVTGQGDGCWLVDSGGQPTGPAVLWNDARAAEVVERWRAGGVLDAGVARSGSMTFAGLPHAILAWFHEHDPERLRRSAHALTCTSWIFHQLTGVIGLDVSEASNPFFCTGSQDYDDSLLELYGVGWARRLLPDLIRDDSRVAPLEATAARLAGLRPGSPVVMAPFDVPATTLGLGVTDADQIACILGTTLSTSAFVDKAPHNGAAGMTLQGVAPGPYLRVLASLAGTDILDWFTRLLGLESVRELAELAETSGGRTPVLLPYLSPGGERAPFLDTAARGSLSGLNLQHDRADVAMAAFTGLTLAVTDCVTALGETPTELRVAGGGAQSDLWCSLLADYCAAPVTRSADREAGAKGALVVAAVATGKAADVPTAAAKLVHPGRTFLPSERPPTGLPTYEEFVDVRQAARPIWQVGRSVDDLCPPVWQTTNGVLPDE